MSVVISSKGKKLVKDRLQTALICSPNPQRTARGGDSRQLHPSPGCPVISIHRSWLEGPPLINMAAQPLMNVTFSWYLHVARCQISMPNTKLQIKQSLAITPHLSCKDLLQVTCAAYPRHPLSPASPLPSLKCYTHYLFTWQWSEAQDLCEGNCQSCRLLRSKLLSWQEANYQSDVISSYCLACQRHSPMLTLCHQMFAQHLHLPAPKHWKMLK